MVTARLLPVVPRLRPWAEPRRLVLVAMLVFGVVYMHGVSAEGVAHHLPGTGTGASAASGVSTATGADGSGADTGSVVGAGSGTVAQAARALPADAASDGASGTSDAAVALDGGAVAPADAGDAAGGHGHGPGDGSPHPVQECLPGQPAQGPALEAPCLADRPGGAGVSDRLYGTPAWSEGASPDPSPKDATGSGILRI